MFTNKSKKKVRYFDVRKRAESDLISESLAWHFACNSGPYAKDLISLLACRDYRGLCEYSIEYFYNYSPFHVHNARQCLAIFQKNVDIEIGVNREEVAYETFAKSEFQCKRTNEWFHSLEFSGEYARDFEGVFYTLRRKIALILGDCPSLADLRVGFGPGSNTTVKTKTTHRYKLDATPVCSKEAVGSLEELWQTIPGYANAVKGKCRRGYGQLHFVPKNAKTDRSIIIEPLLNTFVQKGIGSWIKNRLMMFGCNLKDQTRNQRLAYHGSCNDQLATIDLSSASDTLASALVVNLLPTDWVDLLSNWRTGCIEYKNRRIVLEQNKFSSMGNGFTFELESLIFYCCALAVAEEHRVSSRDISVFGDDIIVPSVIYEPVCNLLELCGFSINNAKSYAAGSFRESCGADYFLGKNVRPFYVKGRWTSARIVGLLNFYFENEVMLPKPVRLMLLSHLPEGHKLYGPPGYGDGHIHSRADYINLQPKNGGYTFKTHVKRPRQADQNIYYIQGDSLLPSYESYMRTAAAVDRSPWGDNSQAEMLYIGYGDTRKGYRNPKFEWWRAKHLVDKNWSDISSREFDPFQISGGFKTKKVEVFTLYRRRFGEGFFSSAKE